MQGFTVWAKNEEAMDRVGPQRYRKKKFDQNKISPAVLQNLTNQSKIFLLEIKSNDDLCRSKQAAFENNKKKKLC